MHKYIYISFIVANSLLLTHFAESSAIPTQKQEQALPQESIPSLDQICAHFQQYFEKLFRDVQIQTKAPNNKELLQICIDTISLLELDVVQKVMPIEQQLAWNKLLIHYMIIALAQLSQNKTT
ncbi:MAG TPA: hypothetical protein VGW78_03645 [Candidatus Babeliales bacterium]|jgi:hypothetical protein|nr:hypothetical protein [Candidatus Babeliales bacterium]